MPNETKSSRMRANITKTILAGSLAVAMVPAWTSLDLALSDFAQTTSGSASSLAWAGGSYSDETTFAIESAKDETVYAKADASGNVTGVYVVNRFAAGSGVVMDPANYLSVSNMTTSDALSQADGEVEVPLQGNQPFYYEGEMAADSTLPWSISIKYFLDDKEVAPAELGGASGKLRIELSVTARTSAPEAGVSDFANSYVMQAQGTFDSASFEMDESDSIMVAQVGSEAVVNCMVLPGESKTFVLEGQANNFTSSGWQISALPLALAINIADQDTSQLTNATSQLKSATSLLSDGSEELRAGMDEAVSGVDELSAGVDVLSGGVNELSTGMNELAGNNEALLEGWSKISSGAEELSEGADELMAGSNTFRETLESAQEEMEANSALYDIALLLYNNALEKYIASPTDENKETLLTMLDMVGMANQAIGAEKALTQVLEGYGELEDGISAVSTGAMTLSDGTTEFDGYLHAYVDGVSAANEGVTTLAQGVAKLVQGTEQLSSGAYDLQEGAEALANGSAQLATSVKDMDAKVLAGIQAAIDAKLGADFILHSFVAPENTSVGSVQFVYMVEGISIDTAAEPADAASVDTTEENLGVIGSIVAWFKGLFS